MAQSWNYNRYGHYGEWRYPCTYSGNGVVTNPSCQPNACNELVFPTRINGVREMGINNVNGNVSRTFHFANRMTF